MPVARSLRAPGPLALPRKSVGISHGDWQTHPKRSRTAAGRPPSDGAHAPAACWHEGNTPPRWSWPWLVHEWAFCGPLRNRSLSPPQSSSSIPIDRITQQIANGHWKRPQPRCGGTLDRVTRPSGMLVPRVRQAPDGRKEGGTQPTDISKINRRHYWLRLFQCAKVQRYYEDLKKLLPTLDIGSHINASLQRLPKAGATKERGL